MNSAMDVKICVLFTDTQICAFVKSDAKKLFPPTYSPAAFVQKAKNEDIENVQFVCLRCDPRKKHAARAFVLPQFRTSKVGELALRK